MLSRTRPRLTQFTALAERTLSSLPAPLDSQHTWQNKAAVPYGANDLRLEDFPIADQVAPGSVRVAMRSVGICGSDVHFLKHVRTLE